MDYYQILLVLISLLLIGVLIYLLLAVFSKRQVGHLKSLLGTSLFLIKVPKSTTAEGTPPKDTKELIGAIEQVYSACLNMDHQRGFWKKFIEGPAVISFEITSPINENQINFFIAVSKKFEDEIKKAIQGAYPEAYLEKMPDDYSIFQANQFQAGSVIKLEGNDFLPIATYLNLAQDPLSQITNALSKIPSGEGAALQLIIVKAPSSLEHRGKRILEHLYSGKNFYESIKESGFHFGKIIRAFETEEQKQKREALRQGAQPDQKLIENLTFKLSKPLFFANIRLISSANSQARADAILSQIEVGLGQFHNPFGSKFKIKRLKGATLKKHIFNFIFRVYSNKERLLLNSGELASIFHLSLGELKTPHLKILKVREVPPPADLPQRGEIKIGETSFRGEKSDVYFLSTEDRRRHMYVIGQTGTGKTALFEELIRQDIEKGRGVAVIDPHGDLVNATLSHIPKERAEDVIIFEPFDMARPIGLNMLEFDSPEQKDFAVQEMIAIFQKLFPPEIIGPMFEHYMRNAMLALMADANSPGTLVEIPRIFTDDQFLQTKLAAVTDPVVRLFWEKEWRQTTGATKSDMLGYVVSKVGRFVENEMMRNIIGQSRSGFNLREIMDQGKIFLANLSKGLTGEVNASLLGLILVSKLQMAAMTRASMLEQERRDFYLYIDEFQNFTTDSIATILSEARKYRLNLIVAHQFIAQLEEKIRDSVFGNVGSILAFRIGAEDAEFVEKQFLPEFTKQDLINLDNFQALTKIIINGKTSRPFLLKTVKPMTGNQEIIEPLKKISKLKYGRPKEIVEKEIIERSKLAI